MSTGCLDSYNLSSPLYVDRSVNNSANIQWFWMLCNEPLAYWQTGAGPKNESTIASRLLTPEYFQRQCDIYFSQNASATYGLKVGKTVGNVNKQTEGWNFKGERILWVNGYAFLLSVRPLGGEKLTMEGNSIRGPPRQCPALIGRAGP